MRKKAIVLTIVLVISAVAGIGVAKDRYSSIFNDLQGHWAEEVVAEFATSRLVDGYADGSFRPEIHVSKAEFSRALVKVYQKTGKISKKTVPDQQVKEQIELVTQAVKKYYAANGFSYPVDVYNGLVQWQKVSLPLLIGSYLFPAKNWDVYDYYLKADTGVVVSYYRDVSPNDWYFDDLKILFEYGIDWGQNGFFEPGTPVNREEVACLLVENSPWIGEGEFFTGYTDLDECTNRSTVERAIMLGLMNGYDDGSFRPKQFLTRAEAVAVLSNYELLLGGK